MKRTILLIITATILLSTFCIGSCKKKSSTKPTSVTNVYKNITLCEYENAVFGAGNVSVSKDCIDILSSVFNKNTETFDNTIYSYDLNGSNKKTVTLNIPNVDRFVSIATDYDGNYLVVGDNLDKVPEKNLYKIKGGKANIIISGIDGVVNDLYVHTDGNIYIAVDKTVYVYSEKGDLLTYITLSSNTDSIITAKSGDLYVKDINGSYYGINEHSTYASAFNTGEIPVEIDSGMNGSFYAVKCYLGAGYDKYYENPTGIYGCDTGKSPVMLLDWINSDLYKEYTKVISVVSPDTFLVQIRDIFSQDSQDFNIALLKRVPDKDVVKKTVLTLATMEYSQPLIQAVIDFNMTNDKYRVVIDNYQQYAQDNNSKLAVEAFERDLISNKIPDIVLNSNLMSIENYTSKGILVDLYELMANDSTFPKTSIMSSVRNAAENDGKLYFLPYTFKLTTVTAKTSVAKDGENLTFDNMFKIYDGLKNKSNLFPQLSSEWLMNLIVGSGGVNSFIDYDKATCNFTDKNFIKLLNFIKSYPNKASAISPWDMFLSAADTNLTSMIKNNTAIFTAVNINKFKDFLMLKQYYSDTDFSFCGFPANSGNGTQIDVAMSLGITSVSPNQAGAWEFLKHFASDRVLSSVTGGYYSLPAITSVFNKELDLESENYYGISRSKGYLTKLTFSNDVASELEILKKDFIICKFSDKYIKQIKDFMNNVNNNKLSDKTISDIIESEISAFLNDNVTAEQTAKFIQNRVSTYLSEKN